MYKGCGKVVVIVGLGSRKYGVDQVLHSCVKVWLYWFGECGFGRGFLVQLRVVSTWCSSSRVRCGLWYILVRGFGFARSSLGSLLFFSSSFDHTSRVSYHL